MSQGDGNTATFWSRFRQVRIALLLFVLLVVLLWAWRDARTRGLRTSWEQPVRVAIVMVRLGSVDPKATDAMRGRVEYLDLRLAQEKRRYDPQGKHPFYFTTFGPVDSHSPPPRPGGDGPLDLVRFAYANWQYLREIDRSLGLETRDFDSRIYVALSPPQSELRTMVEGLSEQSGSVGTVLVELNEGMVDFALFVAVHELFHTLGATDKYGPDGRVMVPAGLAEQGRSPLYPQQYAEIMARNRPISPGNESPPESLDELRVGVDTAREIGWIQ